MNSKMDVLWSPVHHDKFITWGSDITLYEVSELKDIESKTSYDGEGLSAKDAERANTVIKISPTSGATIIASQSGSGVRCVDASAAPGAPDPLLAVGHSSGRVVLTNLKQSYDPLGLAGKEFAPLHSRPCNSVCWSHAEPQLLAAALEKHRSDHCILLWDVNRAPASLSDPDGPTSQPAESRPLADMGLSETAHSVAWAHGGGGRTLLASMNQKQIKIFDLRDLSNKAVVTATTRYCFGVAADPFNSWQLASRGDNVVCVWDTRAPDAPLLALPQPRPVARLLWSPARRQLLLSLQRDHAPRLHDLHRARAPDGELGAHERDVWADGAAAAAAWHPARPRLLLLAGGTLLDHAVPERLAVAWGGAGPAWAGGGAVLRLGPPGLEATLNDVSHVMRRRALTDYGHKPELWQNADLAEDEALSGLWHFLALSKSLIEDGCIRNSPWKHPGVVCVLGGAGAEGYRSSPATMLLGELPHRRVTLFRSEERTRALQLCGWGWGWENAGAGVERLEAEGTPCRAAALAAFHLRLRAALDVLARAREPQLRVVALALAGLSDERLWREALVAAAPALPDAYLRALLLFLASTQPANAPHALPPQDLTKVLEETEMRLEDRVAFACIFLSDAQLHKYVSTVCGALVEAGDLSGILLTGMSPLGVSLLQRWVEASGDVQSAALLAARCLPADLQQDAQVRNWIDSYRTLLDRWQLWAARCALDAAAGGGARAVGVACAYCGKSVAAAPTPKQRRLPPPAAKMKQISSCGNCRKPLARCGVCGLHLGTGGAAPFASWFSWCVSCRHGGHAHHLLDWFREHSECPVSSCSCRCNQLDLPSAL